jgi:seryl-tRNA synthetase
MEGLVGLFGNSDSEFEKVKAEYRDIKNQLSELDPAFSAALRGLQSNATKFQYLTVEDVRVGAGQFCLLYRWLWGGW